MSTSRPFLRTRYEDTSLHGRVFPDSGTASDHYTDPRGNRFYWLSGEAVPDVQDLDVDMATVQDRYISVTPLFYDLTAHSCRKDLSLILEQL